MKKNDVSAALNPYNRLLLQPIQTGASEPSDRDQIIISEITKDNNETLIISRFGDSSWDLRPYFEQTNVPDNLKFIHWPEKYPTALINDCKAVTYAYYKRGLKGLPPPTARGIQKLATKSAIPLIRWLSNVGILRFDQVTPIHINNYIQYCIGSRNLRGHSLYDRLRILDLMWVFSTELTFPLLKSPWGESTLWRICGIQPYYDSSFMYGNVGRTPIIPNNDQSLIFKHCEDIILRARITLASNAEGNYCPTYGEYIRVRDATLYIVSITSGMRNEEAIGIEAGSWRCELKKGLRLYWVSTIEQKSKKGKVEYLVPELTIDALEILTRYSERLRNELANEIVKLTKNAKTSDSSEVIIRLEKAKKDERKIFLSRQRNGRIRDVGHIGALSGYASKMAFRNLAVSAGSSWKLCPHQCRRSYARYFVESRMGRSSLVWLKWQLKHSRMNITELYASNPQQDLTLYDAILQEIDSFKVDLLDSWLGDQRLSGGAGKRIMELRAIPIADRKSLLIQTAPHAVIRATGHGWCLSAERGCGGAGLYESTRCPGCKHSVIDEQFSTTWREIYLQQKELLQISDVGIGAIQRARKDLKIAAGVVSELGIDI